MEKNKTKNGKIKNCPKKFGCQIVEETLHKNFSLFQFKRKSISKYWKSEWIEIIKAKNFNKLKNKFIFFLSLKKDKQIKKWINKNK